ncbi:hypothetical protein B0H21DRAFT_846259 [Amylocystis lapponica]|nr:hypothetical protein B0H21DRAFT_846259 [Amylocystis lapponica]
MIMSHIPPNSPAYAALHGPHIPPQSVAARLYRQTRVNKGPNLYSVCDTDTTAVDFDFHHRISRETWGEITFVPQVNNSAISLSVKRKWVPDVVRKDGKDESDPLYEHGQRTRQLCTEDERARLAKDPRMYTNDGWPVSANLGLQAGAGRVSIAPSPYDLSWRPAIYARQGPLSRARYEKCRSPKFGPVVYYGDAQQVIVVPDKPAQAMVRYNVDVDQDFSVPTAVSDVGVTAFTGALPLVAVALLLESPLLIQPEFVPSDITSAVTPSIAVPSHSDTLPVNTEPLSVIAILEEDAMPIDEGPLAEPAPTVIPVLQVATPIQTFMLPLAAPIVPTVYVPSQVLMPYTAAHVVPPVVDDPLMSIDDTTELLVDTVYEQMDMDSVDAVHEKMDQDSMDTVHERMVMDSAEETRMEEVQDEGLNPVRTSDVVSASAAWAPAACIAGMSQSASFYPPPAQRPTPPPAIVQVEKTQDPRLRPGARNGTKPKDVQMEDPVALPAQRPTAPPAIVQVEKTRDPRLRPGARTGTKPKDVMEVAVTTPVAHAQTSAPSSEVAQPPRRRLTRWDVGAGEGRKRAVGDEDAERNVASSSAVGEVVKREHGAVDPDATLVGMAAPESAAPALPTTPRVLPPPSTDMDSLLATFNGLGINSGQDEAEATPEDPAPHGDGSVVEADEHEDADNRDQDQDQDRAQNDEEARKARITRDEKEVFGFDYNPNDH